MDFGKFGIFKEIAEILGFGGEVLSRTPKTQILTMLLQDYEKSALKHFIQKPLLLNFVVLSTIICPRLSEEAIFISNSAQTLWNLHILYILVFQKTYSLFKPIFRTSEL